MNLSDMIMADQTIQNVVVPDKYNDPAAYAPVGGCGVYQNLQNGCFCLCFHSDPAVKFPAGKLMDSVTGHKLHFVKGYSRKKTVIGGQDRILQEVETEDGSIDSLKKLLNFATAIGKDMVLYDIGGYDLLCRKFGETDCTVNGIPMQVPLYAAKQVPFGTISYQLLDFEQAAYQEYTGGQAYRVPVELPPADIRFRSVITCKGLSYLLYLEKRTKSHFLVCRHSPWSVIGEIGKDELISRVGGY